MKTIITILAATFICFLPFISYSQSWSINGNSGTIPGVNYLGTSDAQPLEFRVNNIKSGYISYSDAPGNAGLGYGVFQANTSGTLNSAFGHKALYSNTTGLGNTGVGFKALYANKSGSYNSALGAQALAANTASYNTAAGYAALYTNSTGTENVAAGFKSLFTNSTGNYNTATGYESLYKNSTGYNNTAIGSSTMLSNISGHDNTAAGFDALLNNIAGNNNTAIGVDALRKCVSGKSNTAFGNSADMTGDYSNTTSIGNQATTTGSNQVRVGNSAINSIGGFADWTNISDGRFKKNIKEDVKGLAFITQLRPVTYTLDVTGIAKALDEDRDEVQNKDIKNNILMGRSEKEKIVYTGFIAQEVEAAAKKTGYNFSGVDIPANETGLYGLRYAEFVVPLVKSVQELSALKDDLQEKYNSISTENEKLKADNESRNVRIAKLESMLDQLMAKQLSTTATENTGPQSTVLARLDQNKPNPFNGESSISYFVPPSVSSASLVIQSINGQSVKSFILQKGESIVTISAAGLSSGTYTYALVLDGRTVASRKIVIAK